ncbi:hypothetical protein NLJ89_g10520 [Agrocybe chaxingu]|uniref:Uncharacterized protein n=1 Tax=Agrocybe chaxingu TaxID=84603 RepID=A0A9W8JU42_9AGAR|nr:hypothetical protein NLJ89_g10520 [Agrocybe chaxingu]
MFSTFPVLFGETYGFRPGVGGLAYLGLGVGFMVAIFVGALLVRMVGASQAKYTGLCIFGFALMTTFLSIQLYLVDAFTYAASATAASAVFRSMLGFAFPLFGQQMFNKLGEGGGNSVCVSTLIMAEQLSSLADVHTALGR